MDVNVYQELLMDHYRNPRNRGTLGSPDFSSGQYNPSCGDSVSMQGHVIDSVLTTVAFEGKGCVISQATASLLTQKSLQQSLDVIMNLDKNAVLSMIGIQLGPTRLKCALLPLMALQDGIKEYLNKQ